MKYYFPELDHYFLKYWWYHKDIYNADIVYPEVELKENLIKPDNFFALLFDNAYSDDHYVFTFSEVDLLSFSNVIRERLKTTGVSCKFYISDSDSTFDYFNVEGEVRILLDLLLEYRLTNSCDLSSVNYQGLENKLSKLIFQYLDLMINDNTSYFEENAFSDSDAVLQNMYESYLLNEAHKKIKNMKFLYDNALTILRPERYAVTIDNVAETNKMVKIDDVPYNEFDFFVFRNGDLLDLNSFSLIMDSTSCIISWDGKDADFKENDVLVADYYVKVN